MLQSSFAPTVAFRSSGQDTDSGLVPAGSVIFWLIWLSTSLLLTVFGPDEQPAVPISKPASAHGMSSACATDFAMPDLSCSVVVVGNYDTPYKPRGNSTNTCPGG